IVNESNTSQACAYCFHKLHHPKQLIQARGKTTCRDMKDAFHCSNLECPFTKNNCGISGRNKLPALAIAISRMISLLL
ncbi:hypothetical protein EDC96DRAFT_441110, partial [Choanephora cucurbitarum]